MTNLTSNKIATLKACLNYDNQDVQLSDNYSDSDLKEFVNELSWDRPCADLMERIHRQKQTQAKRNFT